MNWRKAVESAFTNWSGPQRQQAMHKLSEENELATQYGFRCELDDRRGFGKCLFKNGPTRVWLSPDGWARSVASADKHYRERQLFHTLEQALRGEAAFASVDKFGTQTPTPLAKAG